MSQLQTPFSSGKPKHNYYSSHTKTSILTKHKQLCFSHKSQSTASTPQQVTMHFNFITSLTLIASLTSNALAMPASNQSPNIQKRAEWPDYRVRFYTDAYCDKTTGSYSHNIETCQNLDDFAVDILSIDGKNNDGSNFGSNCVWGLYVFPEYDCEGGGEWWNTVQAGKCGSDSVKNTPIKSWGIYKRSPCVDA